MQKNLMQLDRLTVSERIVIFGLSYLVWVAVFMVLGLFLYAPWLVGGILAVAAWFWVQSRNRRRMAETSGIHGNAHFATEDEIDAAQISGRTDGVILGKLVVRPRGTLGTLLLVVHVKMKHARRLRRLLGDLLIRRNARCRSGMQNLARLPASDAYSHLAVYFSTGVGKTFKSLIPNLFCCPENAVVFDPSGETVKQTAEYRRRQFGHEIVVIDPFSCTGWTDCARINLLAMVSAGDPACFDYANNLGHALVVEKENSQQDPFWHSGAVSATVFLLHSLILRGGDKHGHLGSLGGLINAKSFRELCESLQDHSNAALARRAQQLLNFKGRTLDSLLAYLAAEHGWMDSPSFADVLSGSNFSVHDLFKRKMTIFVTVPGHRAVESRPFLRSILTAFLFAGFEAGPDIHRPPVRYYLDEVATLGKLDPLMALYTQGRKYGMRSVNYFQSVSQVAEIVGSPEKINTFRGQMAAELFKPQELATAKELSEWCGQTTVQTTSKSSQDGTNGGWSTSQGHHPSQGRSGGWSETAGTNVSETGVPLLRPEAILQLARNEALLIAAGIPPVRIDILDAADVQQCAVPDAQVQYQKTYLSVIRCQAIVLFLLVPVLFMPTADFVGRGWTAWTQRHSQPQRTLPVREGQSRQMPSFRGGW